MKKILSLLPLFLLTGHAVFAQNDLRAQRICILQNGNLTDVLTQYNTKTGDTTVIVDGVAKPFAKVYPMGNEYAILHPWYSKGEPVRHNGRAYTKDGYSRIMGLSDLQKAGSFNGVNVYTEKEVLDVVYLPVRQGCEFQPYVTALTPAEYVAQGRNQAKAGNHYGAINSYTKYIKLRPDSSDGYLFRAICHTIIHDKESADIDFAKALQLTKNPKQFYLSRGSVYMRTKNNAAAISDFNAVLKLDPTNAQAKAALVQLGVVTQ